MSANEDFKIIDLIAQDIRWPTSLEQHGSDAMHTDPDYSCVYVTIKLLNGLYGNGLTFTLGRGTEVVQKACEALKHLVVNKNVHEIYNNFDKYWRNLTSESQIRWIGPEKGVTHLAVAAIINALWDLWSRIENKPLWKLLVDMEPEKLISTIDFRYISDVIKPEECIKMLKDQMEFKDDRLKELKKNGYPAYTTQVGWLGYSDEKISKLCKEYIQKGFNAFKIKVGQNLENDIKRCDIVRQAIGWDKVLMIDANQIWDVEEAISWVKELAKFKPLWIEEPTSPDDILGHKRISDALKEFGIGVATGEMCANRIMFKQFLQIEALQFCQIDSARIGGVNEILSVYFMAKKFNIKVCPHAGGVGLCEMVQHLQMWDYISLSGTKDGRYIEYVDQQHDQFIKPAIVNEAANYIAPDWPGYSTELKREAIQMFKYPEGSEWTKLFKSGKFKNEKTNQIDITKRKIFSGEMYD
ncbi:mitochondrial enolase superfamily member 1-like [Condylostylus longicornis]|uniref:mitochondrial enolase superfamily member 1-like n=1 Tax=Condylostylus longicornis TaxID=2530218 RepID=UPI00244E2F93|nr:mitochondrial enolase superfamily member 1-like [Condylostylus longicornis]